MSIYPSNFRNRISTLLSYPLKELEKLASRKLRISAKETMKIAEKLYTQGLISYPRTETNTFPESLDLRAIIQQQTSDPQWGEFALRLVNTGPTPRQGSKTDNAHPPIHPAKYTNSLQVCSSLCVHEIKSSRNENCYCCAVVFCLFCCVQGNDKKVYELVVRHFLACCSQVCVYIIACCSQVCL